MTAAVLDRALHSWLTGRQPVRYVNGLPDIPPAAAAALRQRKVEEQAANATIARPDIETVWQARDRFEEGLQSIQVRAEVRQRIAAYITDRVFPHPRFRDHQPDLRLLDAPTELRSARQSCQWGIHRPTGRVIARWDQKSGLTRLDPDDAREEGQRVWRRYGPAILDLARRGFGIYYAVLTTPNAEPGKLRREKLKQFRRIRALRRAKHHGRLKFPELRGLLTIQEDPLGSDGSWNVHTNAILVVGVEGPDGRAKPGTARLDYGKFRRHWHWDVQFQRLKVAGPREDAEARLAKTFREIIKYSVKLISVQTVTWSAGRFRDDAGEPTAPGLTSWPPDAFLEWWRAQHGFRRTRALGCLYRTPKPEPLSIYDVEWIGRAQPDAEGRWWADLSHVRIEDRPLGSAPGDKLTPPKAREGQHLPRAGPDRFEKFTAEVLPVGFEATPFGLDLTLDR